MKLIPLLLLIIELTDMENNNNNNYRDGTFPPTCENDQSPYTCI